MGRGTSRGNEIEVNVETSFTYAYAEIRTQVVVICDLTPHRLDHGSAPKGRTEICCDYWKHAEVRPLAHSSGFLSNITHFPWQASDRVWSLMSAY